MATIKGQVRKAATAVGDDPQSMVCFYQPKLEGYSEYGAPIRCSFDDLPEREFDDGFGGHEGEPFIGFTDKWVYVCGTYDGREWITAVPRHPETVTELRQSEHLDEVLPIIGGG